MLAFAVYLPLLMIFANDAGSGWTNSLGDRVPWVLQAKFLLTGDYRTHSLIDDSKLRLAFVVLWAVSALGVFLALLVLGRFSFTRVFLRVGAGLVVVAGFPAICVYLWRNLYAYRDVSLTVIEMALALVLTFLYAGWQWPRSAAWMIVLLILHFSFWSWCAWGLRYFAIPGGVPLLWPGFRATRLTTEAPQLIYPWLGFLASVAWSLYVRQPSEKGEVKDLGNGA
jgi:hypothetical protein